MKMLSKKLFSWLKIIDAFVKNFLYKNLEVQYAVQILTLIYI